jgi:uncharacterized membrane protein YphA (DoxX/SURF4 family)
LHAVSTLMEGWGFVLATLFVAAGVLKLRAPEATAGLLDRLAPKPLWRMPFISPTVAVRVVASVEVVVGVGLVLTSGLLSQVVAGAALVFLFCATVIRYWGQRRGVGCGCFGSARTRISLGTTSTAVLLVTGATVFVGRLNDPQPGSPEGSAIIASVLLLAVLALPTLARQARAARGRLSTAKRGSVRALEDPGPRAFVTRRRVILLGAKSALTVALFSFFRPSWLGANAMGKTIEGDAGDALITTCSRWQGTRRVEEYLASRGITLDWSRATVSYVGHPDIPGNVRRAVSIVDEDVVFLWQEPFVLPPGPSRRTVQSPSVSALTRQDMTIASVVDGNPDSGVDFQPIRAEGQSLAAAGAGTLLCTLACWTQFLACCRVSPSDCLGACRDARDSCVAWCGARIEIIPPAQVDPDNTCRCSWTVRAPMDPVRPTTLRMEYGDGASETVAVPQGTGRATFSFAHQFKPPSPPYYVPPKVEVQRASIVETGEFASAVFVHGQPTIE